MRAVLRGGRQAIDIAREAGARKGLFQRTSFWDPLMEVAAAAPASYGGYSYKDRADRFWRELSIAHADRIRHAAGTVRYTSLRDQLRTVAFTQAELFCVRD